MLARECAAVLEGRILLAAGEVVEAEACITAAEERASKAGMEFVVILAQIGLGLVAAARRDFATARYHLEQAILRASEGPARNPWQHAVAQRELAAVLLRQQKFGPAREALEVARAVFWDPEQDNKIEQGLLLCVEAELALAIDEPGDALSALARAEATFDKLRNGYLVRTTRNRRVVAGLARESEPIARGQRTLDPRDSASSDAQTAEISPTDLAFTDSDVSPYNSEGELFERKKNMG